MTAPPRRRLATPTVALTIVLSPAASTASASTSRARSSEGRKRTARSRLAPTSASRVLPALMPSTVTRGTPVQELARNAPSATPGQYRRPHTSRAASAIPVGGHTAVTLEFS
jgi:hypothetical protein